MKGIDWGMNWHLGFCGLVHIDNGVSPFGLRWLSASRRNDLSDHLLFAQEIGGGKGKVASLRWIDPLKRKNVGGFALWEREGGKEIGVEGLFRYANGWWVCFRRKGLGIKGNS